MKNVQDKRIHTRITKPSLIGYLHTNSGQKSLCYLKDISKSGIHLSTASPFKLGQSIELELQIPDFYPNLTEIKGKVVSCNQSRSSYSFDLRMEYLPLSDNSAEQICNFIDKEINKKEPHESFAIKDISNLNLDQICSIYNLLHELFPIDDIFVTSDFDCNILNDTGRIFPVNVSRFFKNEVFFSTKEKLDINSHFILEFPYFSTNNVSIPMIIYIKKAIEFANFNWILYQAEFLVSDEYFLQQYSTFTIKKLAEKFGSNPIKSLIKEVTKSSHRHELKSSRTFRNFERKETDQKALFYFDDISYTLSDFEIFNLSKGKSILNTPGEYPLHLPTGGALVKSPHMFPFLNKVFFQFHTKYGLLNLPAFIKWTNFDKKSELYNIGIQFPIKNNSDYELYLKHLNSL